MKIHEVFDNVATGFEALGVLAMIIGFLIAFYLAAQRFVDGEGGSFGLLRNSLGGAILLGLEILVAADLIRTVTSEPSVENVTVLAIIVLLRTILSMSIQIEIDGTLPWKRALTESGASVLGRNVTKERERRQARRAPSPTTAQKASHTTTRKRAAHKAPAGTKRAAKKAGAKKRTAKAHPPATDTKA
ncbi:DUF1622 domain-containing protein [Gordonia sp. (in: high G+C Gram-positive bacteria)]|uniref:DUF1622 domain-containing protein n=1 Tax=Gordonia sp. (in: high G+C Gram-positive bacteria) TaxID=84139 RepID=UPI0039E53C65